MSGWNKPWDKCSERGCQLDTASGKKERDKAVRFCIRHMPGGKIQTNLEKGRAILFLGKKCRAFARNGDLKTCKLQDNLHVPALGKRELKRRVERFCSVEGCYHVPRVRGLCSRHYEQERRGVVVKAGTALASDSNAPFASAPWWRTSMHKAVVEVCESRVTLSCTKALCSGIPLGWFHRRHLWRVKENVGKSRDMGKGPCHAVDCVVCALPIEGRDDVVDVLCLECA